MTTDLVPNQLDERILLLADNSSPEEISHDIGGVLSPARVASRIADLLKARDWLTERQEEQIVLFKMRRLLRKLEDQCLDLDNAKIQLQYLKAIAERLDKRNAANDADLTTYSTNVGQVLGRVVDNALAYMKGALRDDVDPDKWDTLVREALEGAWLEIKRHEIKEN